MVDTARLYANSYPMRIVFQLHRDQILNFFLFSTVFNIALWSVAAVQNFERSKIKCIAEPYLWKPVQCNYLLMDCSFTGRRFKLSFLFLPPRKLHLHLWLGVIDCKSFGAGCRFSPSALFDANQIVILRCIKTVFALPNRRIVWVGVHCPRLLLVLIH